MVALLSLTSSFHQVMYGGFIITDVIIPSDCMVALLSPTSSFHQAVYDGVIITDIIIPS